MPKLFLDGLRRPNDFNNYSSTMTITLHNEVIELLKQYGIESRRGGGNFSAAAEIALQILVGIFNDPVQAESHLLRLIEAKEGSMKETQELAENLMTIGNLLYTRIDVE